MQLFSLIILLRLFSSDCLQAQMQRIEGGFHTAREGRQCMLSPPPGKAGGGLYKQAAGLPKQPRRGFICRSNRSLPPQDQSWVARYKKVTTWPLVQVASGPKVVSVMPFVTSFSTAQATAFS